MMTATEYAAKIERIAIEYTVKYGAKAWERAYRNYTRFGYTPAGEFWFEVMHRL